MLETVVAEALTAGLLLCCGFKSGDRHLQRPAADHQQATAQGEAAEAAVTDAKIHVAAEVAKAYVMLRSARRRLAQTPRAASL